MSLYVWWMRRPRWLRAVLFVGGFVAVLLLATLWEMVRDLLVPAQSYRSTDAIEAHLSDVAIEAGTRSDALKKTAAAAAERAARADADRAALARLARREAGDRFDAAEDAESLNLPDPLAGCQCHAMPDCRPCEECWNAMMEREDKS